MCDVLRDIDIENANIPVDGPLDVLGDTIRNPGVVWLETVVKGVWLGV